MHRLLGETTDLPVWATQLLWRVSVARLAENGDLYASHEHTHVACQWASVPEL